MHRAARAATALVLATAAPSLAQFNDTWATFTKSPPSLGVQASFVSGTTMEVDLAAGDLDNDGFVDLVVARKQPFTTGGKRTQLLLMNEQGKLQDRTSRYATASDVPGDLGFDTPVNNRDAAIADLDQDGWAEVVSVTSSTSADPKAIGHPRVYRNLAHDGSSWRGLRHEDARIPQLVSAANGQPFNPRFSEVAAGDVTGDGAPDLYFVDHDSSGTGGLIEPALEDLDDRLLVNDGNGYFTDASALALTPAMLKSAYGVSCDMADFNLDGALDVVKDSAGAIPQYVAIEYNAQATPGSFADFHPFHTFAPYHVGAGDLNGDGRPDVVITDDLDDRYRFNVGTDANGRAIWSNPVPFSFLASDDDGFGGNNGIVDLDGDGWNDVFVCDVDADIPLFNRRLHLYHNRGGTIGGIDVVLREERQNGTDTGWIGAVGLSKGDLTATYDVAALDIEGDRDKDLVIARSAGTFVYLNAANPKPPASCQTDLGFGTGGGVVSLCGGDLSAGTGAVLRILGAPPGDTVLLLVGLTQTPTHVPGLGTLVPLPPVAFATLSAGPGAPIALPVAGGGGPLDVYVQGVALAASKLTNALKIHLLP